MLIPSEPKMKQFVFETGGDEKHYLAESLLSSYGKSPDVKRRILSGFLREYTNYKIFLYHYQLLEVHFRLKSH